MNDDADLPPASEVVKPLLDDGMMVSQWCAGGKRMKTLRWKRVKRQVVNRRRRGISECDCYRLLLEYDKNSQRVSAQGALRRHYKPKKKIIILLCLNYHLS